MRPRLALLALLAVLAAGCAHRVRVESDPQGASVKAGKRMRGPTPQELTFLWLPFRALPVRVSAPGYRAVELHAHEYAGLWTFTKELFGLRFRRLAGLEPRATIQVVLVREHGPVGTWTEEEIE